MADLDAELLALAGGDSSDEEDTKPTIDTTKGESISPPTKSPVHNTMKASTTKAAGTPKKPTKMKAGAKKSTKKGKREDSEEEGEASSDGGSPNSLDSAPMSESEAEQSSAGGSDKNGPIFPVDNKFYSEKDKAEIMSLNEVRREAILAERAAILERKQQDQILRKLYQGYQAKEGDKPKTSDQKKRKAGTAELEDVQRKSSRQKTTLGGRRVGETSDAMEAYKRQREQKGIMAEQRKTEAAERKARKGRASASDGSEADADGESEIEWDDGKPRPGRRSESGPRDELPAEMIDYEHVRIGRDNFAKVCFYPGFDDAIKNCYVRISIGPDKTTGENVYRLALIKGFTEGKPYAMDGVNGKPFTTNQYALVAVGKSEKEWPFIACSNSKFTVREYDRYKKTIAAEGLTLPTKSFLISKVDAINKLINHRFTEAEIQEKLKRSGVLDRKFVSIERASLSARRKEAEAYGDEALIAKIDAQLIALDGPKLAFGTSLYKPVTPKVGKTQQERLAEINKANRKANTHDVRKAQLAERKAEALARAAVERGEAVANPFARVKTYAKTYHEANAHLNVPKKTDDLFSGSEGSRAATPVAGGTSTPKKETSSPKDEKPLEVAAPVLATGKPRNPWIFRPSQLDEAEVLASIDFGIDIEV